MKRDLKSAFRHIPIKPLDHWLLIFEWNSKFYVDMFLPFGLYSTYFLHWIFEELLKWKLTHYLDDFLFVFPMGTDVNRTSRQYNDVLATVGLTGAPEKNMDDHVIIHLGFEFDTMKMEVRLPKSSTHYLDDFLFVFPMGTDVNRTSRQYNDVLATIGLTGAPEKNMDGHVIIHLGFEYYDTIKMEVRLPAHKSSALSKPHKSSSRQMQSP